MMISFHSRHCTEVAGLQIQQYSKPRHIQHSLPHLQIHTIAQTWKTKRSQRFSHHHCYPWYNTVFNFFVLSDLDFKFCKQIILRVVIGISRYILSSSVYLHQWVFILYRNVWTNCFLSQVSATLFKNVRDISGHDFVCCSIFFFKSVWQWLYKNTTKWDFNIKLITLQANWSN